MALSVGDRLGAYEILATIGAGGMGEVYRARDLRLGRDVAIKSLPNLSADPESVARFAREAQILASLNHPHIAAIYGLEEANGAQLLVLELVDGDTLADRLHGGPLALTEGLTLARQVADALDAAHEKGIIHRDLKPANIALTTGGQVKVLDFGLAKAIQPQQPEDLSHTPTLTRTGTKAGVILGTPAYMSPEQTRGKPLDKRTDVWAFGCVLYEMLTGRRAFLGETLSDTVAAILEREPDWRALPASTPARIQWLLRRCLEKDPKQRLHDIGDARIELDEALRAPIEPGHVALLDHAALTPRSRVRERIAWIVAGASVVALVAALAFFRWGSSEVSRVDTRAYRSSILLPEGARPTTVRASGRFALSPDGRRLVFVAQDSTGSTMLWVRALETTVAQPLAGTEDAAYPFWSPDSRFVAFQSQGKLKKIDASGGPTTTLCDALSFATGTWNRDDVILFTPKGGAPLYRVSALGGTPTPATTLEAANGDAQHWFPFFLPDGRHFLYFAMGSKTSGAIDPRAVYVGSLDSNEPSKLLLRGGSNAKYAQGHLFFLRGRTLMAQPFDGALLELRGEAVTLAEQVQIDGDTGIAGGFSVADTGVLAYQTGLDAVRSQLTWFDRAGKQIGPLGDPADYGDLTLSADGRRAAVSVLDPARNTRDLWLYDMTRGLRTRLTSEPADEIAPIWSPDFSRVIFASGRKGGIDIYEKALSGAAREDLLLEESLGEFPTSPSPDGRFLMYVFGSGTMRRSDLWVLPLYGDRKPFPFMETSFTETQGQFSPDGRWIAYTSNESGQYEVYVRSFPGPGSSWQVSPAGGSWPRWRRDGTELFFLAPGNTLTSATVSSQGSEFAVGVVRPLFAVRPRPQVRLDAFPYDVSPDGQRFLVNSFVEETASAAITLMVNWTAGLNR